MKTLVDAMFGTLCALSAVAAVGTLIAIAWILGDGFRAKRRARREARHARDAEPPRMSIGGLQ